MQWNREEFLAHMRHEFTGKEMFCELFGLLGGLEKEWAAQGATEDEINLSAFGWDSVLLTYAPINNGPRSGLQTRVLEETAEHVISIDNYGRKTKLCKGSATIALPLEFPVKTMDDWLKIKHWYQFDESRLDVEGLRETKKLRDKGYLICAGIPGGFDEPRQLMGEEELCVAFYEEPELVKDILDTIADTNRKLFERALEIVPIDCLCVHEDMAGKSGPLAGPAQIEEFIKPYYLSAWNIVKNSGCEMFSQDSDGDMSRVVDVFLDCGVTSMYPCEPVGGMDMVVLKEKYGKRLSFKGGIDKHTLRGTKNDILKELEYKLNGATRGGGVVFALDHRIPNGVPIENYRYYVKLGREILGLPDPVKATQVRMAF